MKGSNRLQTIDTLRGLTMISMIAYHLCWDLVYAGFMDHSSLDSLPGVLWQKSICCSFILISGFCFPLGHRRIKKGALLLFLSCLITAVTCLFMPAARIVFGILTLLGSCVILTAGLDLIIPENCPRGIFALSLLSSLLFFVLTFHINSGSFGFPGYLTKLPGTLYHGLFMTYLGFKAPDFFSTDYFSIIPWYFLYLTGYFLYHLTKDTAFTRLLHSADNPISALGRHSLLVYMLHQPVLYGLVYLISSLGIINP